MSLVLRVDFLSVHNIFHFVSHYNKKSECAIFKGEIMTETSKSKIFVSKNEIIQLDG